MASYRGGTPLSRFLASQTLTQLRQMKSEVRGAIEDARSRTDELESDLARIEAAIQEKGRGPGRRGSSQSATIHATSRIEATPLDQRKAISLRQAILALMRDNAKREWTTQEMLDELLLRQHAPTSAKPLNTVGSRMIEMTQDGLLVRQGRGVYALAPSDRNGSQPSEAGDSD